MFDIRLPSHLVFQQVKDSDIPLAYELLEVERTILHRSASAKRLREFTLGRVAAHRALEALGVSPKAPILAGSRGEPLWPEGTVGSISHSDHLAASLVGRTDTVRGIGLDLQTLNRAVGENVGRRICLPSEMTWCRSGAADFSRRLLLTFSAKEALFKALYPLCRTVFYFHDAEVEWDTRTARFEARLQKNLGECFRAGEAFAGEAFELPDRVMTYMILNVA